MVLSWLAFFFTKASFNLAVVDSPEDNSNLTSLSIGLECGNSSSEVGSGSFKF